ncbi:tetratricopeptide repeat protein [Fictibacillus phosphorivorans]|uniref:tetratricopeptide repeat protein n=1 Tax=Fictibacillus phosphorivorans TaxID=1221500 RepID=UPI00203F98BD|nr:tetratricopeptide repeat protein [Fictibacillus phosphorivorans]MCM3717794.1 tetratricopeptide repeat protein [Fictibacillus phosphorivorans]MCM3777022.1 tetratricopeptide repeat protein [Fictibacillus phosphorivorans]
MIYHNLGSVATQKGDTEQAIELYSKSLAANEEDPLSGKIMTIFALIKAYEKADQPEKGLALIDSWLDQVQADSLNRGFELHFLNGFTSPTIIRFSQNTLRTSKSTNKRASIMHWRLRY